MKKISKVIAFLIICTICSSIFPVGVYAKTKKHSKLVYRYTSVDYPQYREADYPLRSSNFY